MNARFCHARVEEIDVTDVETPPAYLQSARVQFDVTEEIVPRESHPDDRCGRGHKTERDFDNVLISLGGDAMTAAEFARYFGAAALKQVHQQIETYIENLEFE